MLMYVNVCKKVADDSNSCDRESVVDRDAETLWFWASYITLSVAPMMGVKLSWRRAPAPPCQISPPSVQSVV